jgi:heme/copper-type cytochrome/quinol oxidase subunit 3
MSTVHVSETPPRVLRQPLDFDQARGHQGMLLFLGTEAALFTMLFFSYFFLAHNDWRWLSEPPPKMTLAFVMLAILLTSSMVLRWGEKRVMEEQFGQGRAALLATIVLGFVFLTVQSFEYKSELAVHTPRTDVYGSIFFTITTFHAAHLMLGLLMLCYVLALPRVGRTDRPPHRAYSNAALYWHFVDVVWIFIVGLLYVLPNLR